MNIINVDPARAASTNIFNYTFFVLLFLSQKFKA